MEFTFNEKSHRYFLDGKPLSGVTTVLGVIAKPALINWAARMSADYILENLKDLKDLEQVCELAKNAHNRKKDKGAEAGSDIHAWIESWIKDSTIALPEDPTARRQAQQFVKWAEEKKVKFLESEKKMYSEEMWLGGTVDAVATIDGKKYVVDFKTQARLWDRTPFLQTAAYRLMLEEMGEKDFYGSLILLLPKEGKLEEHYSYDEETDKEGFMSALWLYRIINEKV